VEQLSLDDWSPGTRPSRARRRDSAGSHAAADALERTGRAAAQFALVLAMVRAHAGASSHGRTSKALAAAASVDRYLVARRLPELAKRGLVERVSACCAQRLCESVNTCSLCGEPARGDFLWRARSAREVRGQ